MLRTVLPLFLLAFLTIGCKSLRQEHPSSAHDQVIVETGRIKNSATVFEEKIRPLFEHRCAQCHNNQTPSAGMNLQNRDLVLQGNSAGPFIVPGDPENSRIWQALVKPGKHPKMMPGDGWRLPLEETQAIEAWIVSGAHWPEGEKGQIQVKDYKVDMEGYL